MSRTSTANRPTAGKPIEPPPAYLRLQTAASLLDVSVDTIRRRIADGTLPAYRVGGQLRIREADLDRLVVRVPAVGAL